MNKLITKRRRFRSFSTLGIRLWPNLAWQIGNSLATPKLCWLLMILWRRWQPRILAKVASLKEACIMLRVLERWLSRTRITETLIRPSSIKLLMSERSKMAQAKWRKVVISKFRRPRMLKMRKASKIHLKWRILKSLKIEKTAKLIIRKAHISRSLRGERPLISAWLQVLPKTHQWSVYAILNKQMKTVIVNSSRRAR